MKCTISNVEHHLTKPPRTFLEVIEMLVPIR